MGPQIKSINSPFRRLSKIWKASNIDKGSFKRSRRPKKRIGLRFHAGREIFCDNSKESIPQGTKFLSKDTEVGKDKNSFSISILNDNEGTTTCSQLDDNF